MQAIWGGRWQDGASATTGEEVEQINSHFSRLGTMTKHMLPEGDFVHVQQIVNTLLCKASHYDSKSV